MGSKVVLHNDNPEMLTDTYAFNPNISLKAKGLMRILVLSHKDGISINRISEMCTNGQASIEATIKELKKNGYLSISRMIDERGFIDGWKYDVYLDPNKNPAFRGL